jgi:hypothetical protein
MGFGKALVRYTVIAGIVGGAAAVVVGPERVAAVFSQTRGVIQAEVDKHIEDPVALRAQLRSLEAQYPPRIAAVESDLAQLASQKHQLENDLSLKSKVVALVEQDLGTMQQLITRASETQAQMAGAVVRVSFNSESLPVDEAYAKASQLMAFRDANAAVVTDIERDLGYLGQQETRLVELRDQLRSEQAQFQTQLVQLDHQVDAIARNERMIGMLAARQKTIDEQSRYRADSLDQIQSKLAQIRTRQESQLDNLGRGSTATNYEQRARVQLDARNTIPSRTGLTPSLPSKPATIHISPESLKQPSPGSV